MPHGARGRCIRRPVVGVLCLALAVCLYPVLASAGYLQTTAADLIGTVVDASGAVLPGATVTAINRDTGLVRTVHSGEDGRFAILALPVGTYRLEAQLAGFEPSVVPDVVLTLGLPVAVTLPLQIAGVAFDVDVVAERDLEDPRQPGVGRVIERAELERLPVNVRNYLAFSLMTPAAATDRTPQQGASRTSGLSFSGQRARSNNIVVDGFDNNDEAVGSVRAVFSQDAVQEFQVLAHGFSAEFGKAAGGVVNIVTRTGTNTPRGTAFLFARDDSLSSRNHFDVSGEKAPYGHRQAGATFGGPLRRDRTFLFGSLERLSIDTSNFVTIDDRTAVPHPFQPGVVLGTPAGILRQAGFAVETGHVPYVVRSTQWLLRLDHYFDARHRTAVRINGATELNENIEPFGGLTARSRAASLDNRDLMIAGSHYLTAPRFVNELRVLAAQRNQDVWSLDPRCAGPCNQEDEGGPTLEVGGVANVGRHRFTPTPRDNVRYQVADTVTSVRGTHTLKAGGDLSVIRGRRQSVPLHFGGRYIFAALPAIPGVLPVPVSSIQAVALGLPAAYVQGYGFSGAAYNAADLSLFAEDAWQARRTLALRYGVRYQRQFWPSWQYEVPGVAGSYPFQSGGNNVAPRLGITWSPAEEAPVVRGGYGIYHDHIITAVSGVTRYISGGEDGVRTLVLRAPQAWTAWGAPERRLPESVASALAGGSYPSVRIAIEPDLKSGYAHHAFGGIEHRVPRVGVLSATAVFARGFNQIGTIDYNPVIPALGPGRRPNDIGGVAGTSASVLQYTTFGETWYRGLTLSLDSRLPPRARVRVAYTLSKAEDTSTDFQSSFLPQANGFGRDPDRPRGLPLGFDPMSERGPALHDRRHRLVVSATAELRGRIAVAALTTMGSGWPYNILAGADLNGDQDGGNFPSDRARFDPADAATSVRRNAGRLPMQASVDLRASRLWRTGGVGVEALFEAFNVFNRTNFTDVQNVFGTGPYPSQPAPGFGQFTQADIPRQFQLALRLHFGRGQ